MSEEEASHRDSGAPRERRTPAELVKRLAAVLCGPSSDEYTVSQLGDASKVLDRLFVALSQVCVFGHDLRYVRRGLSCCAAAVRAHQLLDDSPAVCANTIALIGTLVGMAVQPTNVRTLPDVGSEDDSTDEESEFDTPKDVQLRAAKRSRAWTRQQACKNRIADSMREIEKGTVVDYAMAPTQTDAGATLQAAAEQLEINMADAVRMKEAALLLEPASVCHADAVVRLERVRLLSTLGNAAEFDPMGAQPMPDEDRARGIKSLLASAGSEAGQSVLKDLLTSLRAPRRFVGVRRTLLLGNAAASAIAKDNLETITQCHADASRGVVETYSVVPEGAAGKVQKAACVLTALALALCRNEVELRRGDAFSGRVQLPFLCTHFPKHKRSVLVYVETADCWLLTERGHKGMTVLARRNGIVGLECLAVRMAREHEARRVAGIA